MAKKKKRSKRLSPKDIILQAIPPPKKVHRRLTPYQQYLKREVVRKEIKYKYTASAKKHHKKLYAYAKSHKAAVARRYNKDLDVLLDQRGYFKPQIKAAKRNTLVGKNVKLKLIPIVDRYNKNHSKAYVKGKWISIKKARSLQKRAVKRARIESYMDILGVTKEKAKEILKEIEKETTLSFELKALIY